MLNFRLAEAGMVSVVVAAQNKRLCCQSQKRDSNIVFGREDKVRRLLYSAVVLDTAEIAVSRKCLPVRVEPLSSWETVVAT